MPPRPVLVWSAPEPIRQDRPSVPLVVLTQQIARAATLVGPDAVAVALVDALRQLGKPSHIVSEPT